MYSQLIKENGFTFLKRQEANDIPQKLGQMQTAQMAEYFSQIYKLLHCLEQATVGIIPYVNMDFKQKDSIFTPSDKPLKISRPFSIRW